MQAIGRSTMWFAGGVAVAVALGGLGVVRAADDGGNTLNSMTPCRLTDTRPAPDTVGPRDTPLGADEEYVIDVHGTNGNCTIPAEATAIVANVVAVGPTAQTFLALWPADGDNPGTAGLNVAAGQGPTPNSLTVGLSPDGQLTIYNRFGSVNVIIDITAYYAGHDHDDRYYTKAQVDAAIAAGGSSIDAYTKAETEALLDEKANTADVYSKTETYSQAEVDALAGGFSQFYTVSDSFTCSTGGPNCAGGSYAAPNAQCDADDFVTGGGAVRTSTTGAFPPQVWPDFPGPGESPTSWTTTNALNFGDNNTVTVHAICADIGNDHVFAP